MSLNHYVRIEKIPPRTTVSKTLFMHASQEDCSLRVNLIGGWTELHPQDVVEAIQGMQQYLNDLKRWECDHCGTENQTVEYPTSRYDWIRCPNCKKKTKLDKIRFF